MNGTVSTLSSGNDNELEAIAVRKEEKNCLYDNKTKYVIDMDRSIS
jgi:hypothetical protein